jgi:protein-disulfide isomerase
MVLALALAMMPATARALQQEAPARPALSMVDVAFLERADNSRIYEVDSTLARIDEFVDFGCPTCRSFYILRTDSLKASLVDAGKANFIVRMFPLPSLMRGFHAAEAALCAGGLNDRSGFEAMQHRLYMNQSVWQPLQDPIPVFLQFAVDVGLPLEEFQACLIRDTVAPLILSDMNMAQLLVVEGTPTFVLNRGGELTGDVKLTGDDGIASFEEAVSRLSGPGG